jgi:putative transposase
MQLADLLSESYAAEFDEAWERERTATSVRVFAVRLHATGCSLRETQAILRLLGIERSHQAIWHWVHRLADSVPDSPTAKPSRVTTNQITVKANGGWSWVYDAIDADSILILDVTMFG